MKKNIITIAGRPGSGKSTTAKILAENLSYQHFSSGDLFRQLAADRGIDLINANITAEKNIELDILVDKKLQELATSDKMVIDSRTAWHWMPDSFKVFLDLDLAIAAERILAKVHQRNTSNETIPEDHTEYTRELQRRMDSESKRYTALYKINPYDLSHYDLVIDTATNNLDEVVEKVLNGFKSWLG